MQSLIVLATISHGALFLHHGPIEILHETFFLRAA
jgi:hypothetical protein